MIAAGLDRVSLTSADVDRLGRFYVECLGFVAVSRLRVAAQPYGMASGGALVLTLALGAQHIELVQFDHPGAAYPEPASSHDPWFQHFAIIVGDMDAAMQRLRGVPSITQGGPVRLPASSGGVTAMKLRDPELHPFELLHFPPEATPEAWRGAGRGLLSPGLLGIDHSAIVVADTARSVAFYRGLGLTPTSRSLNQGAEQERLDNAAGVRVEVTGLSPARPTPHVELLCYRSPAAPAGRPIADNDIAATRLVFGAADTDGAGMLLDPDGHRLMVTLAP